jgi:hypothetical protein
VAPPHWASLAHPWQVFVTPLHTGVVPLQFAFVVHRTHVPVVVRHTGVAPPHAVAFELEHWPHAPEGWQAGVAPPHCASFAQP